MGVSTFRPNAAGGTCKSHGYGDVDAYKRINRVIDKTVQNPFGETDKNVDVREIRAGSNGSGVFLVFSGTGGSVSSSTSGPQDLRAGPYRISRLVCGRTRE